jgi:ABC-type multidrug transport system, ATPase component
MLEIRDLVKVYPGYPPVTALHGVSLDIPQGMFGLLGPNGAGKSTLMRVLAGVLEATSGSVTLDGVDVLAKPEKLWPVLGYLPQEFGFYGHLTGAQMLDFLLTMKGVEARGRDRKNLVGELLERVNLAQAARRRVREYSGGMKQRLGIAQAIAGDPKLIIVDEPTAGLDPEERHRFYRILAELAEDRTVILSTHIVEDVAVLCRRLAMIRGGQVVARTTPAAARAALDGRIFEGPATMEQLKWLRDYFCVTQAVLMEGINRVRVYQPDGTPPALPGFAAVAPTLEDAYLAVMRGNATLAEPPLAAAAPVAPPVVTGATAPVATADVPPVVTEEAPTPEPAAATPEPAASNGHAAEVEAVPMPLEAMEREPAAAVVELIPAMTVEPPALPSTPEPEAPPPPVQLPPIPIPTPPPLPGEENGPEGDGR